jgi:hypothetical protein
VEPRNKAPTQNIFMKDGFRAMEMSSRVSIYSLALCPSLSAKISEEQSKKSMSHATLPQRGAREYLYSPEAPLHS